MDNASMYITVNILRVIDLYVIINCDVCCLLSTDTTYLINHLTDYCIILKT